MVYIPTVYLAFILSEIYSDILFGILSHIYAGILSGILSSGIVEGSLEVKLPTIWRDGKAEVGRVREERNQEVRRSKKRESEKQEDAGARKGGKVTIHCVLGLRRVEK